MPFDPPLASLEPRRPAQRPVALWLFALCAMVLVMVTLGGATRLTGSGLSIMEWAPIMGALPPSSDTEWNRLYALYQQTPQYHLVNRGFGLAGFKGIFWLEWVHRAWGRLMGAALLLPLLWFAVTRRIGRRLAFRLAVLLVLGGLQGAVGWFMVASGFEADRTAVSPYRLVMHLALAVSLYAALLWTALGVWRDATPPGGAPTSPALRRCTALLCAMVALTILAGGFVAGLHAGLTYNTFPLMDGRWIPTGYATLDPLPRNLFENDCPNAPSGIFCAARARPRNTPRVLELCYTAHDLKGFADDLGYAGPPFRWDEERRLHLRCQLDALYFSLYGLTHHEASEILDTFPIVRRQDEARANGRYRTRDLILAYMRAYDGGSLDAWVKG